LVGFGPRECEHRISCENISPGKVSDLNVDEIMTCVSLGGGVPPHPAILCSENSVVGRGGGGPSEPLDLLEPSPPPSCTGLRNCCRWQGPRDPPSPATEFSEPGVVGDPQNWGPTKTVHDNQIHHRYPILPPLLALVAHKQVSTFSLAS
jgi:hypothetical protein